MSEWISVKDKKPEQLTVALVFNEKGWMTDVRATYHPREDAWILYDPHYRERVVLEVTHYLPIPGVPGVL